MSAWFRNSEIIFPIIYNYSPITGELIGEGCADPSPLEEGVFTDPAHSTRTAPPAFSERQKPIWSGKQWTIVADYRGDTWFDGEGKAVEIKELGNPADNGLFAEKPHIPEPEPTIRDLLLYNAQKRYQLEIAGIVVKDFKIATDDRSKTLITGLRIKAEANPSYLTEWKVEDGNFVKIDAKMVITISDAVLGHIAQCFAQEAIIAERIKNGQIIAKSQIDNAYGDAA